MIVEEVYSPSLRRLIVEAGFAAVNHGLRKEMRIILAALPDWVDDPELLASCQAILLCGLGDKIGAAQHLDNLDSACCQPLRMLLNETSAQVAGKNDFGDFV